jgi:hypothetical protein
VFAAPPTVLEKRHSFRYGDASELKPVPETSANPGSSGFTRPSAPENSNAFYATLFGAVGSAAYSGPPV